MQTFLLTKLNGIVHFGYVRSNEEGEWDSISIFVHDHDEVIGKEGISGHDHSFTHEEMGGWDRYQFIWSPDGALVAYTEFSELVIWKPGWFFSQFDD